MALVGGTQTQVDSEFDNTNAKGLRRITELEEVEKSKIEKKLQEAIAENLGSRISTRLVA